MNKNYQANFRYKRPSEGEYNYVANFIALSNYFIYFDGVEIDSDSVLGFHQSGSLFDESFKLGSTVCRQVELRLLKSAVSEHPTEVLIKDPDNVVKFTLQVDSVDDTNIDFYDYVLVDKMVNLNQNYNFSRFTDFTIANVLSNICNDLLNCEAPEIRYGSDIIINYSSDVTAREIVSWIAEINCSFARIDESGNLQFVRFLNENYFTVPVDTCKDFKLGELHIIDRVYIDLGVAAYGYPSENQYNTLYINPDNQLISDYGDYTIQSIIEHMYSEINGFMFYSIRADRCLINQDSMAGDMILFTHEGNEYPTIAQIDWDFSIEWLGGYVCEIETKKQGETNNVPSTAKAVNTLKINVDRQNGIIRQEIASVNDNLTQQVSAVQQTAAGLEIRVTANENDIETNSARMTQYETSVNIDQNGVRISQGTEGTYTLFTADEIDFYVQGVKNTTIASDGLTSEEVMIGGPDDIQKWHIHEANDGATLMFLRR